nr:hypothetical protein [Gammaproteobacteria bacterium]
MMTPTIHNPPTTFESSMPYIKEREGTRYVNDPNDSGGATKWGITAKTLGRWRRLKRYATNAEVKALTLDEATEIYLSWYWDAPRYEELPEGLRFVCFDTGIHGGQGRAMQILQDTLNAQAGFLRLNDRLVVDGHVGDRTLDMAKRVVKLTGDWKPIRDLYSIERRGVLVALANDRPKDRGYILNAKKKKWNGWIVRPELDMSEIYHYDEREF